MISMSRVTSAFALCGLLVTAHSAEPILVSPKASGAAYEVKANNVSKEVLTGMCAEAVKRGVYPVKLFVSAIDAKALDETNFTCVVSGNLEDTAQNQRLYQTTGVLHGTDNVQYAVNGNIKTGKMDVARTDTGKAKEVASIVLAGMFMDIQAVSVEPKKAVYTAKVVGGTKCTITMIQDGEGETVRWLASDVQCGQGKSKQ